jgi:peptide/nickel transport system substrate-binding protein
MSAHRSSRSVVAMAAVVWRLLCPAVSGLFVIAAATGNVGCGKKTDRDNPRVQASQPEAQGPQRGGYVKVASNEPRYLNPVLETRADSANSLIFEGLVGLDTRLDPVPRLAEKFEITEGGKVVTFHLRKGVKWHDGQPFTSKDVQFTFDAIRSTKAPTLWKGYLASVQSLETPDAETVVVRYAQPYAPAVVTWTLGILPAHVYGGDDLTQSSGNKEPVGTGPFKLDRWEAGKRIILKANDNWWFGRPHLDGVELVLTVPNEQVVDMMMRGQLDLSSINNISDWLNRVQVPEFRDEFEVSDVLESKFRVIAWNTQRAPFDDKRVRTALTLGLDRGRVIDEVLLGQAQPMSGPFFPNMFASDPSIAPLPFDPARAGKVLDESGHPVKDGKRFAIEVITLDSQRGPVTDSSFGIFRNDLKQLGIDLKVTYLQAKEYTDRIVMRDFDAAYFGWLPDIPDPDPYLLLHSSQIAAGVNFAGYSSAEVDKLLEEARSTTVRDQRKAIYAKVHRIVADDLPYTALYAPFGHYAWSRRLHGVSPRDLGSHPVFPGVARWWISQGPIVAKSAAP